jgi:Site-specific recombinase XerD
MVLYAIIPDQAHNAFDDIQSFLNEYTSHKTKNEYRRDIEQFFKFIHNINIKNLKHEHIYTAANKEPLQRKHIVAYREYLLNIPNEKGKVNSAGTINRKISTLRNLYKYLEKECGYRVNPEIFNIDPLVYNPKKYDVIKKDDVRKIADLALKLRYGNQLHVFIYLATVTSIRVNALLKTTKDDIVKDYFTNFYLVKTIDKRGQLRHCPIEKWLYDKIEDLFNEHRDNLLFPNLTTDYINKSIKKLKQQAGLPDHLRIVTHSLRKVAPTYEMKTVGNVKNGMAQTGHKSVQTFLDTYVEDVVDYNQLAGIRMFREIDESVFEIVDKSDILQFLKKINSVAYEQLAYAIKEYIENEN